MKRHDCDGFYCRARSSAKVWSLYVSLMCVCVCVLFSQSLTISCQLRCVRQVWREQVRKHNTVITAACCWQSQPRSFSPALPPSLLLPSPFFSCRPPASLPLFYVALSGVPNASLQVGCGFWRRGPAELLLRYTHRGSKPLSLSAAQKIAESEGG